MKNIHVISTNKPSRLIIYSTLVNDFRLLAEPTKDWKHKKHIYITSDEETKDGDLCYDLIENDIIKRSNFPDINGYFRKFCRKIILTTDPDLIKDGVQSIDDTFLKWFVKNPNCEIVEITHQLHKDEPLYKIIIPQEKPKQLTDLEIAIKLEEIEREEPKQEQKKHLIDIMQEDEKLGLYNEPKQETLEEVALNYSIYNEQSNKAIQEAVKFGAKWQSERMYSEVDMKEAFIKGAMTDMFNTWGISDEDMAKEKFVEWFEKYKK